MPFVSLWHSTSIRQGRSDFRCWSKSRHEPGIAKTTLRIAALASAGEVLLSSTVKDLMAGSGLRLGDRGYKSLKGVPDDWHISSSNVERTFWTHVHDEELSPSSRMVPVMARMRPEGSRIE